jgi:DNA (cytosine-5)-methyltransferase 1
MERMKFIDLFAGIGGIRIGFENVFNGKSDFVFASEFDYRNLYQLFCLKRY